MNIKLDEKPTSLGTYSIPSASLYVLVTLNNGSGLNLSSRHLYCWVKEGLAGGYLRGVRNRKLYINYKDLISLRAIASMRAKGMKHHEIIVAEKVLQKFYNCEYPFATYQFWTAPPRDIFIKEGDSLLSASRHLQSALDFFEEYLQPHHNMTFDMFGISANWRPQQNVLFDPQIQYGEPCIEGTRVPTQVIWSFYEAGDSIGNLSFLYGIQESRIEDAIVWENKIQKVAQKRK